LKIHSFSDMKERFFNDCVISQRLILHQYFYAIFFFMSNWSFKLLTANYKLYTTVEYSTILSCWLQTTNCTLQCSTVQYSTVLSCWLQTTIVHYSAVQCRTVQLSVVQYSFKLLTTNYKLYTYTALKQQQHKTQWILVKNNHAKKWFNVF